VDFQIVREGHSKVVVHQIESAPLAQSHAGMVARVDIQTDFKAAKTARTCLLEAASPSELGQISSVKDNYLAPMMEGPAGVFTIRVVTSRSSFEQSTIAAPWHIVSACPLAESSGPPHSFSFYETYCLPGWDLHSVFIESRVCLESRTPVLEWEDGFRMLKGQLGIAFRHSQILVSTGSKVG
jgi:hypothetical protein